MIIMYISGRSKFKTDERNMYHQQKQAGTFYSLKLTRDFLFVSLHQNTSNMFV